MIFVAGEPLHTNDSPRQGREILDALLENPDLVSASRSFRDTPEKVFGVGESSVGGGVGRRNHVYLFQREFATVDPRLIDLIGTDEATTCVGLVIRNRENGMTSVAHMDSQNVIEGGLSQMLSDLVDPTIEAEFDQTGTSSKYAKHAEVEGHSLPLCVKLVEVLGSSRLKFHIQTLFVLRHNTRRDSEGKRRPIFDGFLVETSAGSVVPARFDTTTRCPDEIVRRIRVFSSFEDLRWTGKLLDTYNWRRNQFVIASCLWTQRLVHIVSGLRKLPDSYLLSVCSTSPDAEGPDFIFNHRRMWDYLIRHPNWKETFPKGRPRIFERNEVGDWTMLEAD
ncbi:N-terminal asparagine amidohydrolase-like protein [Drosera capensis]